MEPIDALIKHYEKEKRYCAEGEVQLIDKFLVQNLNQKEFSPKAEKLMKILVSIDKFPPLKPLQLIRLLTRSKPLLQLLPQSLLTLLNQHLSESQNFPSLMVQSLAIHLRYIELDDKLLTDQMFARVLDILSCSLHSQILQTVFQIIKDMIKKGRTKVIQEIAYISQLLFILDRIEDNLKIKVIKIITILLSNSKFNENFRRIHGVSTLINTLKKCGEKDKEKDNIVLKVTILNAIEKLLEQSQAIYDFKVHGIIPLLKGYLQLSSYYVQVSLIINIFNKLIFDDDLNMKFIQSQLPYIMNLLIKTHTSNHHLLKYQDIQTSKEKQAISALNLLLFRLLRFLFSIQKNRKIFKLIFPSQLLGPFIDIGNFVKSINKYKKLGEIYNKLSGEDVENILEKLDIHEKEIVNDKGVDRVGSYILVEKVGKGAFGTVYLAKKGENKYALKKIPLENDDQNLRDTMKEVKIYEELKHPNIVTYYESFVEDECLCIVMEFIEGFSLSELLKIQNEKSVPFEEKAIWKILISLISVLKYLHVDKKILHLDLNPSNIMIDNSFNIKLADFGLAKRITQSVHHATDFEGTLMYSAPEIVSRKPYSHKADIWSFGCVIYELMMLKPPFYGDNTLKIVKIIVNEDFTEIPKDSYSSQLISIVNHSLQKDQQVRADALTLMGMMVDKIMNYADTLRDKQITLNRQIIHLTKKLNRKQPIINNSFQQAMRQTQLVKIDTHNLNKIGQDPLIKFLQVLQKLSFINTTQTSFKNNFKKFSIDLFYNKVIMNHESEPSKMKGELSKLINLSKEEIEVLKFNKKESKSVVTYEMLYFYIEELYELLKK